jgi:hypothetical protein
MVAFLATVGCSSSPHPKEKASVTTETTFTQDRDQRIKDRAAELKAKGVPADVANRRASQQVPMTETTTTQTGDVQKQKDAQEQFEKDLAKSTSGK